MCVWPFALSGLYMRVLDGQIVCQIGCLYLLMQPCSPSSCVQWAKVPTLSVNVFNMLSELSDLQRICKEVYK